MGENIYFLCAMEMLLILTAGALAIAGANYLLAVGKEFVAGDARYRLKVLAAGTVVADLLLAVFTHWLATPPG